MSKELTRQVYNLFQDLWKKPFMGFKKVKKGEKNVQKCTKVFRTENDS